MFSYLYNTYDWIMSSIGYSQTKEYNHDIIDLINKSYEIQQTETNHAQQTNAIQSKVSDHEMNKRKQEFMDMIKIKAELISELKEALRKRRESLFIIC